MSVKGLKQKVAATLVAVMTVTNVFSAAGADTLQIGTPSQSKSSITLTFNAGDGGSWDAEWASKSNYTASKSNPQIASKGDAAYKQMTAKVTDKGLDKTEFDGKTGYVYTSLEVADGEEALNGKIKEAERNLKNSNESLKFAGWYADVKGESAPVTDKTEVFSNTALTAKWYNPSKVEAAPEIEDLGFKAVDLGDKKVTATVIKENPATTGELEEYVSQYVNIDTNKSLKINGEIFGMDINVENYEAKDGKVTISMKVPEELKFDGEFEDGESIKVIHLILDKADSSKVVDVEVLDTAITEEKVDKNTEYWMTFKAGSFSPFYVVRAVEEAVTPPPIEAKDVKVTIESAEDGYVAAWTETYAENGRISKKYLPIGEEVTLKSTDWLHFEAYGYNFNDANWYGKCESLSKVTKNANGEEELTPIDNFSELQFDEDCKIRAQFKREERKDDEGNHYQPKFEIYVDPDQILGASEEAYSGKVIVEMYNKDTDRWDELAPSEYKLRPLTLEELEEMDVRIEGFEASLKTLSYDADTNTLMSEAPLTLREYKYPFAITYRDEPEKTCEVFEDEYGEWKEPYCAYISVGADMIFMHGYVNVNGKYGRRSVQGAEEIGYKGFFYNEDMTWNDISDISKSLYYGEPEMYNGYVFAGWQDYEGNLYTPESSLVRYKRTSEFYVYDVFVKEDTTYSGVAAEGEGIDQVDLSQEIKGKPDDGDNQGGGSSSGGGSRYGGGGSSSAARDYTMHGNWMATENGWRFLKDSGEYATNTWGYINGQWYYFDAQGNMVTGWYYVNSQWYYMNPAAGSVQGAMMTGWVLDPTYNAWFYLTGSGAMATGWQQINGLWYYLNPVSDGTKGVMAANTYVDGYFVNADGVWVQ